MNDPQSAIRCLECIAHSLIEAMGMQAENTQAEIEGKRPPYDQSAFMRVAEDMRGHVAQCVGYV